MQVRDFLLLAYGAFSAGRILGKTNLQKRIYLLGAMLGYNLEFEPHQYGPYSSKVAGANSQLKSLGYLKESVSSRGEVSPEGFEKARYDYELSEDGRRIVEEKKKERPNEWKEFERAVRRIEQAGPIDYVGLAIAAKAHFLMVHQGGKAKLRAIKESARDFKWLITEKELRGACEFLKKLGLVTIKEIASATFEGQLLGRNNAATEKKAMADVLIGIKEMVRKHMVLLQRGGGSG